MEVIEHANRIERALQDENQALDTPETDHLTLAEVSDSEIIAETKPRRIPLAEQRLSLNPPGFTSGSASSPTPTLNYVHATRLSMQKADTTMMDPSNLTVGYGSPMKLDTPFKHLAPGPNEPSVLGSTPQSVSSDTKPFRQVKSSKSMASLKSTYSLLSRLKSNDDTESISPSEDGGSSIRKMATDKKGSSGTTPGNPSGPRSQRLSHRSESANGLLVGPSSNPISSQLMTNRRPTSTIGSISTPGTQSSSSGGNPPDGLDSNPSKNQAILVLGWRANPPAPPGGAGSSARPSEACFFQKTRFRGACDQTRPSRRGGFNRTPLLEGRGRGRCGTAQQVSKELGGDKIANKTMK
ncbi:G2-specific serine/threonine protein kinase [Puccinia graminis f. sp. tritici]|uniref:G2-specific serine/threonine protein kinase n=1 Tax=Puccinia graminis f. sp. tritici TaxID=56615 RepID=A0A5B0SLF8_PUCGR|nr:G2-specific serine/threonine protein kinase [Puccinia graminis f. sp. tritici]